MQTLTHCKYMVFTIGMPCAMLNIQAKVEKFQKQRKKQFTFNSHTFYR